MCIRDRLRSNANISYTNLDYTDNNNGSSSLDQIGLGLGLDYNWSENIIIGTSYNFSLIDYVAENYDRHTFEIYASGRF